MGAASRASAIRCSRAATPRRDSSRSPPESLHAHLRARPRDARDRGGEEPRQRRQEREGAPAQRDHHRAGAEGAHHRVALRSLRLLPDHRRRRGRHRVPRRSGEAVPQAADTREGRGARRRDGEAVLRPDVRLSRLPLHAARRGGGVCDGGHHAAGHRLRRGARLLHVDRDTEHRGPRVLQEGRGRQARRGRAARQSAATSRSTRAAASSRSDIPSARAASA